MVTKNTRFRLFLVFYSLLSLFPVALLSCQYQSDNERIEQYERKLQTAQKLVENTSNTLVRVAACLDDLQNRPIVQNNVESVYAPTYTMRCVGTGQNGRYAYADIGFFEDGIQYDTRRIYKALLQPSKPLMRDYR